MAGELAAAEPRVVAGAQQLSRLGVASSIAIAMTVAVAILIGSFRTTVVAWADDTLKADLFVRPMGLGDASSDATFSPRVASTVARLPGVASIDVIREISIPFRGRITNLAATDLARFSARSKVRFIGRVDQAALQRLPPESTSVLISEPFATKFGLDTGDRFRLDTPAGLARFTVAAVYNDYSSDAGVVLLDLSTFRRYYRDPSINSIAVYARPGADLVSLRDSIVRSVLPLRVDTETTRELRALVITIFDRTFAITYALYVISITIAVLGVVSTLFALVLERRREIGLLRYLGLRTRDVRRLVYYEAGFIGLLGGISGVAVGVLLALLLIFVINRQAFGWLIELHMPYDFLVDGRVMLVQLLRWRRGFIRRGLRLGFGLLRLCVRIDGGVVGWVARPHLPRGARSARTSCARCRYLRAGSRHSGFASPHSAPRDKRGRTTHLTGRARPRSERSRARPRSKRSRSSPHSERSRARPRSERSRSGCSAGHPECSRRTAVRLADDRGKPRPTALSVLTRRGVFVFRKITRRTIALLRSGGIFPDTCRRRMGGALDTRKLTFFRLGLRPGDARPSSTDRAPGVEMSCFRPLRPHHR